VSEGFEDYVTVADAAKRLNIHPESVRRLIRNGKLPARKFANHYDPRPGKKATLL
jgi:excisionase family DNA binding protein